MNYKIAVKVVDGQKTYNGFPENEPLKEGWSWEHPCNSFPLPEIKIPLGGHKHDYKTWGELQKENPIPSLEEIGRTFSDEVDQELKEIGDLLKAKNESYGDSALNPINIFSKLSGEEAIKIRLDDKISRLKAQKTFGNEDTIKDLIGYLILLRISQKRKPKREEDFIVD